MKVFSTLTQGNHATKPGKTSSDTCIVTLAMSSTPKLRRLLLKEGSVLAPDLALVLAATWGAEIKCRALASHTSLDTKCKTRTRAITVYACQVCQRHLLLSEATKTASLQTFEACLQMLAEPCLTLLQPLNCLTVSAQHQILQQDGTSMWHQLKRLLGSCLLNGVHDARQGNLILGPCMLRSGHLCPHA